VRALAQTRDGYLWIGSEDGVARFDGVRFVSFGLREGLRSGPVRALFEDSHGALWIGTVGSGLTRWQEGQFTTFTTRDGLPANSITALGEDSEGRLWVGTEAGLAVWQNGRLSTPASAEPFKGKAITTLRKNPRGVLWMGASGAGVFQLQEGKFAALTEGSVEGLLQDPHCLLEDKAGRVWVGAGDDFVLCRDGGQWRRYRIPRHLARPYVSALTEAPDGTVWAGSVSEGLFQFKEGKLAAINASSGLLDNAVESLLVDQEGNLWVGTGAGLNRLRRSNLLVFGQNEGLGYGPVQGLAEIAPGVIWAGKPDDGLYRWEGRNFSRLTAAGLSRRYPEVISLLMARNGDCWISGANGLWRFKDPKHADDEVEMASLPGLNVIALAEDSDGGVWAGTREGQLWRRKGDEWLAQTNYSQSHPITAILHDHEGILWLGTEGDGLYRYQAKAPSHFEKGGGLLSDWIRTLYLDAQGTLWIGTAGGGLSRWRDGRLATFTTREGLADNTISQIMEDGKGRLWLGSNRGIACVAKRELEDLVAGKIAVVYPQAYGRAEGMPSEECTGGFFPAGLKTQSGQLCFSTLKGIVVADPRPQNADAPAPAVVLEETMVDGVAADMRLARVVVRGETGGPNPAASAGETAIRIGPGKHRLEFRYTGMSFSSPERVRFRYRLEPLDTDWVEAGARRTAFYSYVPPGQYRFRVIACNSAGIWSEAGAGVSLIVSPHLWQAWWVIAVASLGLLGAVAGTVRVAEKKKHQRRLKLLEQERALEHERARIAQDLHDDLGSSLTRISLLSDLARADKDSPSQVEAHAQKISQSAGQTVRALEEIVWALRPGSDSLQSLVEYIAHFANELFEGDTAHCRLDLPHDLPTQSLPPEMRHNIFLVVKEALTNAFKHGHAREVRVQAKASARTLEMVVQDDGQGFEEQALPPAPGKRHGLGNMRRRAEAMGGTLAVDSARGKGTTVRLLVNFPA
jgi:signal transduction histidine kinase/ligand-binding sensor domain-containing protein